MTTTSTIFTIFFDGHLWVGVLEQHDGGRIRAARVVFGREPSDVEVANWLRHHGDDLIARASAARPVADDARPRTRARSPKRAQREAARAARRPRFRTAAQEALAADRQARAVDRAQDRSARRGRERAQIRAKRRARAKARHRGR